jgi:hypothetical protein
MYVIPAAIVIRAKCYLVQNICDAPHLHFKLNAIFKDDIAYVVVHEQNPKRPGAKCQPLAVL